MQRIIWLLGFLSSALQQSFGANENSAKGFVPSSTPAAHFTSVAAKSWQRMLSAVLHPGISA
jgi:hypothetical protein